MSNIWYLKVHPYLPTFFWCFDTKKNHLVRTLFVEGYVVILWLRLVKWTYFNVNMQNTQFFQFVNCYFDRCWCCFDVSWSYWIIDPFLLVLYKIYHTKSRFSEDIQQMIWHYHGVTKDHITWHTKCWLLNRTYWRRKPTE